jgi:hypothetical protein
MARHPIARETGAFQFWGELLAGGSKPRQQSREADLRRLGVQSA